MIEKELYRRHGGSSHYANIPSGYYLLLSCFIFIALVSLVRRFLPHRANQRGIKWVFELNPILLVIYFTSTVILLMVPVFITGHEHYYNIFTKRLGRIAYGFSNLIILIMLQEPLSVFNGVVSYLEFIPLHKWLSRGAILMSLLHGVLFIVKWYRDPEVSLWNKMVVKRPNFVGLIISIMFCYMLMISIKPMRCKSYRLFYISHQIINVSFIILIPFHARPGVTFPFLIINLLLMTVYCLNKTWKGDRVSVLEKVETYDNQFYIVTLPYDGLSKGRPASPGSHIRISPYARYDIRYWLLPSHPYTIATYSDHAIKLIIKKTHFQVDETRMYTVCGPYCNTSMETLIQQGDGLEHVILIAGGSGISFILPIYIYLLNNNGGTEGKSIKIIWMVKDIIEYEFIRDKLGIASEYFANMDIYITVTHADDDREEGHANGNGEDIELQNFIPVRKSGVQNDKDDVTGDRIKYGRINWDVDMQELCGDDNINNSNNKANNYIIGCGPESLIKDCELFGSKNGYRVITEYYSI